MRDLPFVPFFTGDWLASSARIDMTLAERAIYLDLLFHIWERGGSIPSDQDRLAKMAMVSLAEFSAAWPAIKKHIVPHPDEPEMLTNLKMLAVIQKQARVHEARSNSGRMGAASRWADSKADGKTVAKVWHPETESESETEREREDNTCAPQSDARNYSLSSNSSKTKTPFQEKEKATPEQQEWFASWWEHFWLKKDRARAHATFVRAVQSKEKFDQVMAATIAQTPEMLTKEPRHRPYATTWLERERWNDQTSPSRSTIPDITDW